MILPRQGEVAPTATEGGGMRNGGGRLPPPPSGCGCHLPLAGEDHAPAARWSGSGSVTFEPQSA